MSGYFKSLVKQSGLSIGGSPSPAIVHATATRPMAVTPLHVNAVALIEPTAGQLTHSEGRTTDSRVAFGEPPAASPNSNEVNAPSSISSPSLSMPSNQAEERVTDSSETAFVRESRLVVPERTTETISEVNVSQHEVIENQTKTTAGVVRVGEHRNTETLTESDARIETASALARPGLSIPPDYLEGIREWLTSPPANNDEITADRSVDPQATSSRENDRLLRPNIELDVSSRDELQEFSLSIGSISIVVEEPARQQPPPSTNSQPVERARTNAQPRAKDAFALSRSYFRGF